MRCAVEQSCVWRRCGLGIGNREGGIGKWLGWCMFIFKLYSRVGGGEVETLLRVKKKGSRAAMLKKKTPREWNERWCTVAEIAGYWYKGGYLAGYSGGKR